MKNKALISSLLAILLILSFSNVTVSRYIKSSLNGTTISNRSTDGISSLSLLNVSNVSLENEEIFLMMLFEWSIANKTQIIRSEYSEAEEVIRYYVTDFEQYVEKQIINKHYLKDADRYKKIETENNQNIFKGNTTNFEILTMLNFDADISINNIYITNATSALIEDFIESVKIRLNETNIEYEIVQVERWKLFDIEVIEASMGLFTCGLILFVILISYLIKDIKKIALMKIEGHSSLYILNFLCGKSLKTHIIALLVGLSGMMFWFVPITMTNALLYYGIIAVYLLIYLLELGIFTTLLYFFIKEQKIVPFLKGKNKVKQLIKYLQFTKIIVLILSVWFMASSIPFIYSYAKDSLNKSQKLEIYNNIYMIVGVKGKYSTYFINNVIGNESEVVQDLSINSNLFFAQKSVTIMSDSNEVVIVDENYLKMNNLWNDNYSNKNVMFTNEQTKLSNDIIRVYDIDKIEFHTNKMKRVDPDLFGIREFFSAEPYYTNNTLFFYDGKGNQVDTIIYRNFYYCGDLTDARIYLKDILNKHGFEDYPIIISATKSYQSIKKNTIQSNVFSMVFSFGLLGLYACIMGLIFNAYYQSNVKKNMIMWTNGRSRFIFFKKIIIINIILLCLVVSGMLVLFDIDIFLALAIAICFLLIELARLVIYVHMLSFDKLRRYI